MSRSQTLSTYILPGRIRDPSVGLQEAIDAERAGFTRVWISERYDLKELGVLSGAVAAVTSRIGVASGLVALPARHPLLLAAYAATMQATFGDRLLLGVGGGFTPLLRPQGMPILNKAAIADYVDILRRLWQGETVSYDGPAGSYPDMKMVDSPSGPPPPIIYGAFGGPRAMELVARHFDGVIFMPFLTVDAVGEALRHLHQAADRAGRDPASIWTCHTVVAAPNMNEDEILAVVHARALTYLQMPGYGDALLARNGWNGVDLDAVRRHPLFGGMRTEAADQEYHRAQLVDAARLLPGKWMNAAAAIGSPEQCVTKLDEYFAVGVDEICLHGASPAQNGPIATAWREGKAGRPPRAVEDRAPASD
jgi:5,10-methylenetetrahydromethanopterin reductase